MKLFQRHNADQITKNQDNNCWLYAVWKSRNHYLANEIRSYMKGISMCNQIVTSEIRE